MKVCYCRRIDKPSSNSGIIGVGNSGTGTAPFKSSKNFIRGFHVTPTIAVKAFVIKNNSVSRPGLTYYVSCGTFAILFQDGVFWCVFNNNISVCKKYFTVNIPIGCDCRCAFQINVKVQLIIYKKKYPGAWIIHKIVIEYQTAVRIDKKSTTYILVVAIGRIFYIPYTVCAWSRWISTKNIVAIQHNILTRTIVYRQFEFVIVVY